MWTRVDGVARYIVAGDTLYVWCSGSRGRDWIRNLRWRTEPVAPGVRVLSADLEEARDVWRAVHREQFRRIHIIGFSRGGAVAQALSWWIPQDVPVTLELYAPKRVVTKRPPVPTSAHAWAGDIVPFLPPWLRGVAIKWRGPWRWPWRAHRRAAREAARRRHDIGR